MTTALSHRLLLGEALREEDRLELLQIARRLRAENLAGHPARPLAGRHFAIMSARGGGVSAGLVAEAAGGLGAHVSRIDQLALGTGRRRAPMARLLGSLYDAIECGDLSADAALALEQLADRPTFRNLGDEQHPIRKLLPALKEAPEAAAHSDHDDLVSLLQAILVESVH
jgi:ornithine carbamoyltransferase